MPARAERLRTLILPKPSVESHFGAAIGVVAGLPAPAAITAAAANNVITMLLPVWEPSALRERTANSRQHRQSPRRVRLSRAFDKYGVAGVSLVGQTILPSQITAAAMVSFGASKNRVIFWQTLLIRLWGTAFGALAALGIDPIGDR